MGGFGQFPSGGGLSLRSWQTDCGPDVSGHHPAAAGIEQIIYTKGSASLWSPRVLRAGMGAHFSLHTFENIDLEDVLAQFQIPVYVTSSHRAESLYFKNLRKACVWILGNEGQGVSDYALQHAEAVSIPQPGGQESLNVAIAGSICFFEMVRQRL